MTRNLLVTWVVRHGHFMDVDVDRQTWTETAPDTNFEGEVVGFSDGKAIIFSGASLFAMDLDDLTVIGHAA